MLRLYESGASDVEVCKALRISYNEFTNKYKQEELFAELVDYGRLAAKSWWMEIGRLAAAGSNKANYNFWYAHMKNRYGWSDKLGISEEEAKPLDQMSQDELMAEVARKKTAFAKLFNTNNVLLSEMVDDASIQ